MFFPVKVIKMLILSRSIWCCWAQDLWAARAFLSSSDFRSSGGQRSSPLSTSPTSEGSTTMDGNLFDSFGYFSWASGKAYEVQWRIELVLSWWSGCNDTYKKITIETNGYSLFQFFKIPLKIIKREKYQIP